jgi:hypothetical protein
LARQRWVHTPEPRQRAVHLSNCAAQTPPVTPASMSGDCAAADAEKKGPQRRARAIARMVIESLCVSTDDRAVREIRQLVF